MEHDEDERAVERPNALEPGRETVDESQPDDDVDGPDAVITRKLLAALDQSALSNEAAALLATREADASPGDSASP